MPVGNNCQCSDFTCYVLLPSIILSTISVQPPIIQVTPMPTYESIKFEVFSQIAQLLENKSLTVRDDTPLIGGEGVLDSMRLVELCLALEDKAAEIGFEFDWASDVAMSRTRSMFRTADSLATEFISQMESKK